VISLNRDEFCQRLLDRRELFALAIKQDTEKIFNKKIQTKIQTYQPEININIDMTESVATLIMKEMTRIIDLVYDENLD
jgi:hypothetical protein